MKTIKNLNASCRNKITFSIIPVTLPKKPRCFSIGVSWKLHRQPNRAGFK